MKPQPAPSIIIGRELATLYPRETWRGSRIGRLLPTSRRNVNMNGRDYQPCHFLLGYKMKDKQPDIKKQLLAVLFYQNVAGARNVSVKERYFALAQDVGAIHEDKEPKHSKELIWSQIRQKKLNSIDWEHYAVRLNLRFLEWNDEGNQPTQSSRRSSVLREVEIRYCES